tara:strand:- start:1777 stop:2163 length:387 start_codon:yes stop_codon:yes gene_type:complete
MSKTTAVIIVILLIVIGFIFAIKFDVFPNEQVGPYDDFIICLKASGARFYGDYTYTDSLRQMSLFEDSLYTLEKSGVYVECNSYGANPKVEKCREEGINMYPTWIIDGIKHPGMQGLNGLSRLTGCEK